MTLLILRHPTEVLAEQEDRDRWCFACRAHLPHMAQLLGDARGWYEPAWVRSCSGCGEDHTTFPRSA